MTQLTKFFRVGAPRVETYPRTVDCVNPSLVIGLELETENCQRLNTDRWIEGAHRHQFRVDRDGSLRGSAYEFISNPMQSRHALPALQDFLTWAQFNEENYSDRCSVHVHVNCTDMEMEQISNVALLYTVAEEIMFEFVGRHRESNIYCIPWSHCRAHYDLIQYFLSRPAEQLKRWNKYTALNLIPLSSYGTVEFRQMHGTADFGKLQQWINMIGAIFAMAKSVELKDLIAEIKSLNTTSQYEGFFQRMLGGQLPYNETYRQKMEDGVIFAKYSLISMNKKSKGSAPKVAEEVTVDIEAQEQVVPAAAPMGQYTAYDMMTLVGAQGRTEFRDAELTRRLNEINNRFTVRLNAAGRPMGERWEERVGAGVGGMLDQQVNVEQGE